MATNNQAEATLIIKARQQGLETIDNAARATANLTDKVADQVRAFERGEVSAKELTSSLADLQSVGEKLISQAGLIDAFNKRTEALAENAVAIEKAKAAEHDYATELAGSETITKDQSNALNQLGAAVTRLERQRLSLTTAEEKAAAALAKIGVDAKSVDAAETKLATTTMQLGGALKTVNLLLVDFDDNLKRVAKAEQEFADTQALGDKVAEFKNLRQSADYVNLWADALNRGDTAILDFREKAEQALVEFQKVGETAIANSAKLDAFANATTVAGKEASTFAKQIIGIIDPGGAARATLAGLEEQVAAIATQVGEADKPLRNYTESINGLSQLDAAVQAQAKLISQFEDQKARLAEATSAYNASKAAVDARTAAVRNASEPDQQLITDLKEAQAQLKQTSAALVDEQDKLKILSTRLEQAGIDTNDLATAQNRLIGVANTSATTSDKLSKAIAGNNNPAGKFLGLKPYELQNLGYQLNDVFTQLASGTNVTQVIAQQGGQIAQIFPGIFSNIVKYAPEIAAIGGLLALLFLPLKRIYDLKSDARQFNTELSATVDGAKYSADALAKNAQALKDYGAAAADATKTITEFFKAGIDPTRIDEFAKAAADVARVTGQDIPTAAKALAQGFTGGYQAIANLDDQLHFLTTAEREQIKADFDANNSTKARGEALDALSSKFGDAASKARGPWAEAFHELGNAYRYFLDQLANSPLFQIITSAFEAMGKALRDLLGAFSDAKVKLGQGGSAAPPVTAGTVLSHRAGLTAGMLPGGFTGDHTQPAPDGTPQGSGGPLSNVETDAARSRAQDILEAQKEQLDLQRAISDNNDKEVISLTKKIALQEAYNKGLNDSEAASYAQQQVDAKQAELDKKHAEQRIQLEQQVQASLLASANAQDAQLGQRLAAIQAQAKITGDQIDQLARNGADPKLVAASKAQLAAQTAQLENAATLKFYEDQLAETEKTRADLLKTAADELAARQITAVQYAQKVQQANDLLVPKIKSIAADGEKFAASLGAAAQADPKVIDFVQKLKDAGLQAQAEAISAILKGMESSVTTLQTAQKSGIGETIQQYEDGVISAAEALKQVNQLTDTLGKKTADAAKAAADYAAANKAIAGTPEGQAFIAKNNAIASAATATGPNSVLGKAQQQIDAAELQKVNNLIQERNDLVQTEDALAQQGSITTEEAEQRKQQAYEKTAPAIKAQIESLTALIQGQRDLAAATGQDTTAYDALLEKLKLLNTQTTYVNKDVEALGATINQAVATEGVNAFDSAGQAIGNAIAGTEKWGDAFSDLGRAAASFFAGLLKDIAEAILKMEILSALGISPSAANSGGGFGGAVASLFFGGGGAGAGAAAGGISDSAYADFLASIAHGGTDAIGFSGGMSRAVDPALFANAPRYHRGTPGVGLADNERATILELGEAVLTKDDPYHPRNRGKLKPGGSQGGDGTALKQVLVLDPQEIHKVSASSAGEKVTITHIVSNRETIRKVLGIKN
jgi:hypothetical protein